VSLGPAAAGALITVVAGLLVRPLISAYEFGQAPLAALIFTFFAVILTFTLIVEDSTRLVWKVVAVAGVVLAIQGCVSGMPGS
jgi:hypothetical protein